MMQFSLTIDAYKGIPIPLILGIFRTQHVPRVESTVDIFHHPRWASIVAGKMGLGLHLPYVGKYGYDFGYTPAKKEIDLLLDTIQRTRHLLPFDYAVFHPPESDPKHVSYDFLVENLTRLNVPLVLENNLGYSLESFVQVAEKIEKQLGALLSGFCVDIPHAFLAKEKWQSFYQHFAGRVKVVHLSDCDGKRDSHLAFPFAGGLDLDAIIQELVSLNFDGILNFEIKPPSLAKGHTIFQTLKTAQNVQSKILAQ